MSSARLLKRAHASAPGKTILMGEHAAVYGRPALVAAIGRRLHAFFDLEAAEPGSEPGVHLSLPALGVRERVSWPLLRHYAEERRRVWEDLQVAGGAAEFSRLRGSDPAHLVKAALGELLLFAGLEPAENASLGITSELPLGSGFGSSAACATAILLASACALGIELSRNELLHLALEVERRQHGAPSGVDNATVLDGGILWVERDAQGELQTSPLAMQSRPFLPRLRVFQSGEPAEPTGAVVAAVRALSGADPSAFESRLDDMAAATRELRRELESEQAPVEEVLIALFRRFESHLEAFGVVPAEIRQVIRRVEEQGGAAKISGAGSLLGPGAGSLLVLESARGLDLDWPASFRELKLELGAPGARLES